jgi:hypothetical protein
MVPATGTLAQPSSLSHDAHLDAIIAMRCKQAAPRYLLHESCGRLAATAPRLKRNSSNR